ncbi:glutamate synthase (NADPH/NADH) small chain [Flexibacter flexilis DSM 6793]|uniref:Glutamate synthase (NADPH/NADH) small chain n=1 Tax=Flexibacter flexilis DSM 6793 TaxID=927664 RepID=A0A1I1FT99_9BACT|nr:glutamate synthase subunit beta [Flexibacter flexilis]SFC02226.1 glutamate synthase (NADPH/NADH) small chain [Flexibacter flexilis DSM 6793]
MYEYTKTNRLDPEVKPVKERLANFDEIYERYNTAAAESQASRCIQCGIPFCTSLGCPLNNNIPQWLKYIAEKEHQSAFDISNETSPFPEILGRICPHDRLCEKACTLNEDYGAVSIGSVEVFISESGFEKGLKPEFPQTLSDKKVAIIGSGPAGLSCATFLLRAGIRPVIYEKADEAGGLLIYGIPSFKLEKEAVTRRIQWLLEAGMELHLNAEIGKDITFESLRRQYDAVFLAVGATEGKLLTYEGYNSDGVFMAVPFLTNAQKKQLGKRSDKKYSVAGKRVVVVGGGDTAMDCVRTSVREGASSVTCVYRRDEASMPASTKEFKAAQEEGVEFLYNKAPKAFDVTPEGKLQGMFFVETTLQKNAETGKEYLAEIADQQTLMEADVVILALGFNNEQLQFLTDNGITTTPYGTILTNEQQQTSIEGVFAGGDATRGADLVVTAALDGREAATFIAEYVFGK